MIRRALLILLAIAGLGTLAIGITSYWHGVPDNTVWINTNDTHSRVQGAMVSGSLHVVYCFASSSGPGGYDAEYGPFYARREVFGQLEAVGVGMPFWAPAALLLVVPFVAVLRGPFARRRRRKRGRCVGCGYDLTGLTEPRCPECGRSFTPGKTRLAAPAGG